MVFPRKFFVLCCCNRNIAIGRHLSPVKMRHHVIMFWTMSMSACRPVAENILRGAFFWPGLLTASHFPVTGRSRDLHKKVSSLGRKGS